MFFVLFGFIRVQHWRGRDHLRAPQCWFGSLCSLERALGFVGFFRGCCVHWSVHWGGSSDSFGVVGFIWALSGGLGFGQVHSFWDVGFVRARFNRARANWVHCGSPSVFIYYISGVDSVVPYGSTYPLGFVGYIWAPPGCHSVSSDTFGLALGDVGLIQGCWVHRVRPWGRRFH